MSLYDLLIMRVEAPRHSWKWLLYTIRDQGINTDGLDEWLKQVNLGVSHHQIGAVTLEIDRIRDDHCTCSERNAPCASCAVIEEIIAHVPLAPGGSASPSGTSSSSTPDTDSPGK